MAVEAAFAQPETPIYDFPSYETAYDPAGAPMYEMAIVTYGKRVRYEERTFKAAHGSSHVNVSLDQVEIVDSTIAISNRSIMVVPFNGGSATPFGRDPRAKLRELKPGKRYLILTAKETPDALRMPLLTYLRSNSIEEKFWANITPRRDNEFVGLLAIETKAKKLQGRALNPMDRLMTSVARCLDGADLDAVQRVCHFLIYSRYKPQIVREPYKPLQITEVPPEAPYVPILIGAYAKLPPSLSARVAALLSDWNIEGSGRMLYLAIKQAIDDPLLFYLPGDIALQGSIDYHVKRLIHDETAYQAETNEQFDLSLKAKSPNVREFLIMRWGNIVDVGRRRTAVLIAEASNDYNDRLAGAILRSLALWYEDKDHVPDRQVVNGVSKIVNKVELFKYWRTMLGMGIKG